MMYATFPNKNFSIYMFQPDILCIEALLGEELVPKARCCLRISFPDNIYRPLAFANG